MELLVVAGALLGPGVKLPPAAAAAAVGLSPPPLLAADRGTAAPCASFLLLLDNLETRGGQVCGCPTCWLCMLASRRRGIVTSCRSIMHNEP